MPDGKEYRKGLYANLVNAFGKENLPDENTFNQRLDSDSNYRKGVYSNLEQAYGKQNLPTYEDFEIKSGIKKKSGGTESVSAGQSTSPNEYFGKSPFGDYSKLPEVSPASTKLAERINAASGTSKSNNNVFGSRKTKYKEAIPESFTSPIPKDVVYSPDRLDSQQRKLYNRLSPNGGVIENPDLVKLVLEESNKPEIKRQMAMDYAVEEAAKDGVDLNTVSIPDYIKDKRQQVQLQVNSLLKEAGKRLENIDRDVDVLNIDLIVSQHPEIKEKLDEVKRLDDYLVENEKYFNQVNAKKQFEQNPTDYKAIGRGIRKLNDYTNVQRKELSIQRGLEGEKNKELRETEDYNDELNGLQTAYSEIQHKVNSGEMSEAVAAPLLADIQEKNKTLESRYPEVALDNIRKYLGDKLASKRQESDNALEKGWDAIVSAAPSTKELKDLISEARKNKIIITPEQEQKLLSEKDKIPALSITGHGYKTFILEPAMALNSWMGNENANIGREQAFRDPTQYQAVQPSQIAGEKTVADSDGKIIRMIDNPEAGKKAGWASRATLNNIAETAGVVMSYATLNKGFGALAEKALGGIAGVEVVGYGNKLKPITQLSAEQSQIASNVLSSTFLSYHKGVDIMKEYTDDKTAQKAYGVASSLVAGLIWAGINPNKILNVSEKVEQSAAEKFLADYKSGNGNLNPEKLRQWALNYVENIEKDLGHNIGLVKANQIADVAIQGLIEKNSLKGRNIDEEVFGNLPAEIISFAPLSAIAGYKKTKNETGIRNAVRMAIADPVSFEDGMNKMVADGKISPEESAQKVSYVKNLVKQSTSADLKSDRVSVMPENKKFEYAANLLKESNLKEKSKLLTDKLQIDEHNRQVENLQSERKIMLLKHEIGDKNFRDLTEEELNLIEVPKNFLTVKTQPVKNEDSDNHVPVLVNEKGQHEVLKKSFPTADEAKVYGEEAVKRRYFNENISNKKQLKQTPEELIKELKPVKGKVSDIEILMAKSDPDAFLKQVAEQAQGVTATGEVHKEGGRETELRDKYDDAIVDAAIQRYPKEQLVKAAAEKEGVTVEPPINQPEPITIGEGSNTLSEVEKVNRTIFDKETGKVLDGVDEEQAMELIDRAISKSKTVEQANSKLDQLGYILRSQANSDFNKFVQDRIDGKTNKTFKEWREEQPLQSDKPVTGGNTLSEVTDVEYNDFIDKGKVSDERLNDIADKVKNQKLLTDREKEIFTDKTAEVNKIIARSKPNTLSEGGKGVGGDNPALKDVESTAKALEGVDSDKVESVLGDKLIHHGTGNDFSVLEESKQNSATGHGDFGKGFYFSLHKGNARYYSLKFDKAVRKVKSFLYSISSPFEINIANEVFDNNTKEALKKLKGLHSYEKDVILKNLDKDFGYKAITKEIGDARFSEILKTNGFDAVWVNRTLGGETQKGAEIVIFNKDNVTELTNKTISAAYHKAKADGSNPELVKAVEELLGNEKQVKQEATQPTEPIKAEEVPQPKEPITESSEGAGGEPPKETVVSDKEDGNLRDKGFLNRILNAKGTPEAAREGLRKEGTKYETKSQKEAHDLAGSIIDEMGIDEAVKIAQTRQFDGDVNSFIFDRSLERLADAEEKASTPQEKIELAKQFAEIAIMKDEMGRTMGRFNAATGYTYKNSPLGVQLAENAKRKQQFEDWSKPKDQSWKEFFDEMMKEPEFEKVVGEEVSKKSKEERSKERESKKAAVHKKIENLTQKWADALTPSSTKGSQTKGVDMGTVMKSVAATMKAAYDAGDAVAKVIEDAVKYISQQLGHDNWDKDTFSRDAEEMLTGGKKKFTDEELKLKYLDRFKKKLKGLSDKEKDEVVRKSFKKIIESGGLDYEDFRKIIADVTGRGELTPEEAVRLKELVKDANAVDDAAKRAREERTPEAFKNFRDTENKAGASARELAALLSNKPNIAQRINSIMQLNTLGIPALVNNPIYNVVNQLGLRLPVSIFNTALDYAIKAGAKVIGKNYNPETNVITAQKEFFNKLGLGTRESIKQFATGLNRMDYTQKEVYGQQIRPVSSLMDLFLAIRGKKKLTKTQVIDKTIQGTVGVPAEIVARALNLGDKPLRFGAEGAQAAQFAKNLGLKGIDAKLFIEFPRQEAYRVYKEKGLSDAEAAKKADYVRDTIIREGERATFQQDNILNDKLNQLFGGASSGVGQLAKSFVISPYIKIPANAYWSYYNLINPEIALLQALVYGGKAWKNKGKNDNTSAKQLHEARYWLAHAAVGIATRAVIASLVANGIYRSSNDDTDTKKEREGEQYYEPQGTINVSKLNAWLQGKDPSKIKGGLVVQNRWFGHWGTVGNAMARKFEDATPEQREKQDEFFNAALGGMELDAVKDLEQGIFANTSSMLEFMKGGGDIKRWGLNTLNMFANIVQPAAIAQLSRAELPYYSKTKADNFYDELKNSLLSRSEIARKLMNQYPPSKNNIWGETAEKGGNKWTRLFGMTNTNKDNFAQPLYEDYKRTGNTKFFPPAVMPVIRQDGETIKLNTEQSNYLEKEVGKARKNMIAPYINGYATYDGKKYKELSDEEKTDVLQIIYKDGYDAGEQKLYEKYPKLAPKEKTMDEMIKDAQKEGAKEMLRAELEQQKNQ